MANEPIHLVIGTPCYGGVISVPNFTSALKLREYCGKNGIRLSFAMPWGDALVTRARQSIAAYFLEDPTATHLLYIDADISYDVEQVLRLLRFNREVCAGLYPAKTVRLGTIRKKAARRGRRPGIGWAFLCHRLEGAEYETVEGFGRVTKVGTGFLMIQRTGLRGHGQKVPRVEIQGAGPQGEKEHTAFFNCLVDEKGDYLSEDYAFCKRWTDMGGDIWADFQSRLSHTGSGDVQGRFGPPFRIGPPERAVMTSDSKPCLMIATPSYGRQLTAVYAFSVLQFMEACQKANLPVEVAIQWGDALISRARQDLVTRFLETPQVTHLLFIDSDIGFAPEQVFRLLDFDAEMATGVYPYKHLDLGRIQRAYETKKTVKSPELWAYGVEFEDPTKLTFKNGFAKALYGGMGFALIKKSVFQKMIQTISRAQIYGRVPLH